MKKNPLGPIMKFNHFFRKQFQIKITLLCVTCWTQNVNFERKLRQATEDVDME